MNHVSGHSLHISHYESLYISIMACEKIIFASVPQVALEEKERHDGNWKEYDIFTNIKKFSSRNSTHWTLK